MAEDQATADSTLPELLRDWRDIAAEVLVEDLSLDADKAKAIGLDIVLRLAEEYGSTQFYFSKAMQFRLEERDKKIAAEFNGHNFRKLAKDHGVSERHVRRVVKRRRAIDKMERQDDMFPGRQAPNRR